MYRLFLPDNLYVFKVVFGFTPFALDITKKMTVFHTTPTKKAVIDVRWVVLHKISALRTDSVKCSIKLKHVSNKINPLQFVLRAKTCLFLLALGFCVFSVLFEATVVNAVPAISEQIPFLLYLVHRVFRSRAHPYRRPQ